MIKKRKFVKRAIGCFLLFVVTLLVIPMMNFIVLARSENSKMSNNFSDDTVSIVLTNRKSIELIENGVQLPSTFFANLGISEVHHVSEEAEDNVRKQLLGETVENPIDIEIFRISLQAKLNIPGCENVLEIVDSLKKHSDVYDASTNSFGMFS
jgi:hypothetical protein